MIDVSNLTHLQAAIALLIERRGPEGVRVCELCREVNATKRAVVNSISELLGVKCINRIEGDTVKYVVENLRSPMAHLDSPVGNLRSPMVHLDSPVDEYGKPIKERKGEYFRDWVQKLRDAGYEVEWQILCAADYGDPTTRKRLFLQAVKDGKGIHWPKPTHRDPSIPLEKLPPEQRDLPPWKSAAAHVIDWTIPGKSIFYRKKPLATDTIRRIKHGLKTFGLAPYFAAYHGGPDAGRRLSLLWQPLPTLDCSNRFALIRPFISKGFGPTCTVPSTSIFCPLPTITTRDHNFLARPALCVMRGRSNSVNVDDPLSTVSCGFHHQLMRPCRCLLRTFSLRPSAMVVSNRHVWRKRSRFIFATGFPSSTVGSNPLQPSPMFLRNTPKS